MGVQPHLDTALVQRLSLGGDGPRVVVKDSIDIAGTVTSCGSDALAATAPAADHAEVVTAMLAAGCRIIGKARMHELAFGMTGVNGVFGTPVNPMWPDRIPGGSSSGSAVAVASGLCDFAVGTDTGGSVRLPATCCGVFGIKPSYGRISRQGVSPALSTLDCVGAFARDVDMLHTAMAAMDPTFVPVTLDGAPNLGRIKSQLDPQVGDPLVLALMETYPDMPYHQLPGMEAAFEAALVVSAHETARAYGHLLDGDAPLGDDIRARLAAAGQVSDMDLAAAEKVRQSFTAEVDALLAHHDAIVTPALPQVPPTLAEAQDPQAVLPLSRFLRPFNLTGHPAITLPACTPDGLPIGLQIVGRKGEDAWLCAIAGWLVAVSPMFQSVLQSKDAQP